MFINQVEVFLMVAKYKSFSKAGQALFLSQPTISSHIKSLEADLGVQLVVRTTKEVLLSDAGKVFYDYATELLHVRDMAYKKMQEYSSSKLSTLKIAITSSASQLLFTNILNGFMSENPSIKLDMIHYNSAEVIESVQNYNTELGFCNTSDDSCKCTFDLIGTDHLVFVAPNTKIFADVEKLSPVDLLTKIPLVWRGSGSSTRTVAERYAESLGLSPSDLNIHMYVHSTNDIMQAIINGIGASFLSVNYIEKFRNSASIKILDLDSELLTRKLYMVYYGTATQSGVVKLFMNYIKEHTKKD